MFDVSFCNPAGTLFVENLIGIKVGLGGLRAKIQCNRTGVFGVERQIARCGRIGSIDFKGNAAAVGGRKVAFSSFIIDGFYPPVVITV